MKDVSRHVFENEHGATLIVQEVLSASENRKFVMRDGESTWPADTQLATEVLRLAAEVERLRAEREWRPIETAPKDGTAILVWTRWEQTGNSICPSFECAQIANWWDFGNKWEIEKIGEPTHWMPMPEPPDEVCG